MMQHGSLIFNEFPDIRVVSMQHDAQQRRAKIRYQRRTADEIRRWLLRSDAEHVWEQIEYEYGPPYKIADEDLKDILVTQLSIAELCERRIVRAPPDVAKRVLTNVIDNCRRSLRKLEDVGLKRQ